MKFKEVCVIPKHYTSLNVIPRENMTLSEQKKTKHDNNKIEDSALQFVQIKIILLKNIYKYTFSIIV